MKRDYKQFTERAALVAAILYPLSAVPQAIQIFSHHEARGLSLISWVGFASIELVFLLYGFAHNLHPIILSGVLWMAVYGIIIAGIVEYS